jgi:acetylornithine deacetylase
MPDSALTTPIDEATELLVELVSCDSTNPDLVPGGAGEGGVAAIVARVLEEIGLEVSVEEVRPGRPNVIGRLRGTGGGRTLMLCGHTDVVAADAEMFAPRIENGILYGRGASDMKGGLASAICAARRVAQLPDRLQGDLVIAAVIDEEWGSLGAFHVAEHHQADAVILPEYTQLEVTTEHGGFAWYEIVSRGPEVAGIEADRGVDAIALLAPVLSGILELDERLAAGERKPYGRGSIHASTIAGGTMYPAYPSEVKLAVERCTIPGETIAQAQAEIDGLLERARQADPRLDATLTTEIAREAVILDPDGAIVPLLTRVAAEVTGRTPAHQGDMGWMDSGVLVQAGFPCATYGPKGGLEHGPDEWVDLESVAVCADVLAATARAFCGEPG